MTYPPNNPGYPAPQQPGGYGAPPAPGAPGPLGGYPAAPAAPAVSAPAAPAGATRLPGLLAAAGAGLGLAAYLASFGPLLKINADIGPFGGASFTASGLSYWTIAALTASLLAAVSLLPKGPKATTGTYTPIVAVAAVLGVLLVIGQIINRPNGFSIGWALWAVLLFTPFQAVAAVAALLFESGVLTAPAPRPHYEQYGQYGPPPGGYYPQGQRPGYPAPYGNYPTGGFGQEHFSGSDADAPPTPPTGIPGLPPTSGSAAAGPAAAQPPAPESPQGPGSGSAQS
mgnify:FL=1